MLRTFLFLASAFLALACTGDSDSPAPIPADATDHDAQPDTGPDEDAAPDAPAQDTSDTTSPVDPDCACADSEECAAIAGLPCSTQALGFCDHGDCQPGGALRLLHAHPEGRWVQAIAWSADGALLLSVAEHPDRPQERDLRIWEVESGTLVHQVDGVQHIAVSPDGRVAVGMPDAVELWSAPSASAAVERWEDVFGTVAFHPEGTFLASEREGGVAVRDLASGEIVHTLDHPGREGVRLWTLAFRPDGTRLLSGNGQNGFGSPAGSVQVWDLETGERVEEIDCATLSVAWRPDGAEASATCWNTVLRLDPQSWQARQTLITSDLALAAGWTPQGTFWIGTFLGSLRVGLDGPAHEGPRLALDRKGVRAVAVHPDGRRIAVGTWNDADVHLWELP